MTQGERAVGVKFASAVTNDDFEACLPLSDWLEDVGRRREAVLLRRRYARWLKLSADSRAADALVRDTLAAPLAALKAANAAIGRTVSFKAQVEFSSGLAEHQDELLRQYVYRLLEGLW